MHLKGRAISFEHKRRIAKKICGGVPMKVIAQDENVSLPALSSIKKDFVVVRFVERYPDELQYAQLELELSK